MGSSIRIEPLYGMESRVVAAKTETRWMMSTLSPISMSRGAMMGRAMSWPVEEPPVSMHMMATTTAQMRMGEALILVSASKMVWKASELVMMAAKPQMAPTFMAMGMELTAKIELNPATRCPFRE